MDFQLRVSDNKTRGIDTLQINIGKLCNLSCSHCHLEAGPKRNEVMDRKTFDKCIRLCQKFKLSRIDITGGEPTVHKDILYFLSKAAEVSDNVILRSNLVNIDKNKDLLDFLEEHTINIVASLPCYLPANVNNMRGEGAFDKILAGIRALNAIGYGSHKKLDLVYNPADAFLPPDQKSLEGDYKRELAKYGLTFSNLLCITNLPVGNFYSYLEKENKLEEYERLLEENFQEKNVDFIMCKKQISVGYDGKIYDCDFHQAENIPCKEYTCLDEALALDSLERTVVFKNYCYACTAGSGSSCGGSLNG